MSSGAPSSTLGCEDLWAKYRTSLKADSSNSPYLVRNYYCVYGRNKVMSFKKPAVIFVAPLEINIDVKILLKNL